MTFKPNKNYITNSLAVADRTIWKFWVGGEFEPSGWCSGIKFEELVK